MSSRGPRVVAVALVALLLTGCASFVPITVPGGQGQPLERLQAIEGGECFRMVEVAGESLLDFDRRVPCTREHEVEIVRSVVLPAPWSAMRADEVYALTDTGGDVYEHVMPLCIEALLGVTEMATQIGGLPGLDGDIGLWPGVNGSVVLYLTPDHLWSDHPAAFCAYEQVDAAGEQMRLTSPTDELAVAAFGRADAHPDIRLCLTYSGAVDLVDCAEPHHAELLFDFDAMRVFGEKWVQGVDPLEPSDAVWADADAVCELAAHAVFGTDRPDGAVLIRADLLGGKWYEPDAGDLGYVYDYPVSCLAVVADTSVMLTGPVWGLGDAPPSLVTMSDLT